MKWKWFAEIVFLAIAIALAVAVMRPIHDYFGHNFDYYVSNYIFIVLFLTYSRYLFLLKYTPFSHNLWIKLIMLFASIPLLLWLVDDTYDFRRILDETGLEPLINSTNLDTKLNIAKYTKYEYLFFSTGAIITLIMLPFRMMVSIWRVKNNKNGV
ncbi:MAG: hypothetical protein IPN29_14285 [Saprospiraceae bacterium]|nr:hypothetical protein [Saprospiraceae bacterium]